MKKVFVVATCLLVSAVLVYGCGSNTAKLDTEDQEAMQASTASRDELVKQMTGKTVEEMQKQAFVTFKGNKFMHRDSCEDIAAAKEAGEQVVTVNPAMMQMQAPVTRKEFCPKCAADMVGKSMLPTGKETPPAQ